MTAHNSQDPAAESRLEGLPLTANLQLRVSIPYFESVSGFVSAACICPRSAPPDFLADCFTARPHADLS